VMKDVPQLDPRTGFKDSVPVVQFEVPLQALTELDTWYLQVPSDRYAHLKAIEDREPQIRRGIVEMIRKQTIFADEQQARATGTKMTVAGENSQFLESPL